MMADAINEAKSTDIENIIDALEDRWFEYPTDCFYMRGDDHQNLLPMWAGTVAFTEAVPYPRAVDIWAPPPSEYESLYHSISEIKEVREKAGNPYANYLGH